MLWMVAAELVPEAARESSRGAIAASFLASAASMGGLQLLIG